MQISCKFLENFYNQVVFLFYSMKVIWRFIIAVVLIVSSALYIFPWKSIGINIDNAFLNKPYTLGLDLQGGVELDYQVDLSSLDGDKNTINGVNSSHNENVVVEGLKKIIDKRVSSLGLSEPNIQTLKYGTDTHLIVQIPTESYSDLSPVEREKKQKEDIANAKEVIGKVVRLEFRELRDGATDTDYEKREALAKAADNDLKNLSFAILSQKYNQPNDNIIVKTGSGVIPEEARVKALESFDGNEFPYIFPEDTVVENINIGTGSEVKTQTGYVALKLNKDLGDGNYDYTYVRVDKEPGLWKPAKTADGKILNDQYLTSASAYLDP